MDAVDSANPSIRPTTATGAPRVTVRKMGRIGNIISEAKSVNKDVMPRSLTFLDILLAIKANKLLLLINLINSKT